MSGRAVEKAQSPAQPKAGKTQPLGEKHMKNKNQPENTIMSYDTDKISLKNEQIT